MPEISVTKETAYFRDSHPRPQLVEIGIARLIESCENNWVEYLLYSISLGEVRTGPVLVQRGQKL